MVTGLCRRFLGPLNALSSLRQICFLSACFGLAMALVLAGPVDAQAQSAAPEVMISTRAPGLPIPPLVKPPKPRIPEPVFIARHGFNPANVGWMLLDPADGSVVSASQAEEMFLPASVTKVPMAVYALDVLGADYQFETQVLATGPMDAQGIVQGDVILRGEGDPFLTAHRLNRLARNLAKTGVTGLTGGFYFDDHYLAKGWSIDAFQPSDRSYNPGFGALSSEFNRVPVSWSGGKAPHMPEIEGAPPVERIAYQFLPKDPEARKALGIDPWAPFNRALLPPAGPTEDGAFADPREVWYISDSLGTKGFRWLPIRHPGHHTAALFRAVAERNGIVLPKALALPEARSQAMIDPDGPGEEAAAEPVTLLATDRSPSLAVLLTQVLKYSNNVMAELIGLASTRKVMDSPLGLDESGVVMVDYLASLMPDRAAWEGMTLPNHSGLSSSGRMSPAQTVAMIDFASAHRTGGVDLRELLPQKAFRDDQGRFPRTRKEWPAVWAKSGTIWYGRGLAGFIETESGRSLIFALYSKDIPARTQFDTDRSNHYRGSALGPAQSWMVRARKLERDIILEWIAAL
ncbi:MAG: D-alanyl-D-alanine carboxypeptidase/D-alanyl-D-alanine-endopeptidase [Rhodospirillaceae bacterium]